MTAMLRQSGARFGLRLSRPVLLRGETVAPILVYSIDPGEDEVDQRQLSVDRVDDPGSAEQVALLAAELVYSRLVSLPPQVEPAPAPVPEEPPRPPPVVVPPKATWSLQFRVGAWLAGGPNGTPRTEGVLLGMGIWRGRFGVELRGDMPVRAASLDAAQGSSTFYMASERAHLMLQALDSTHFGLAVGLGGGALQAWGTGAAVAPYRNRTDLATASLLSSSIVGACRITSRWAISLEGRAAWAFPQMAINFARAEQATLGRPLLDLSLSVAYSPGPVTQLGSSR